MTSKERFHATIERAPVDRPASWLGLPTHEAYKRLKDYFHVSSEQELKAALGDDVSPIEVPYHHLPANHIACAFDFGRGDDDYEERTLTTPGFFENVEDPKRIDEFAWPDPNEHMNQDECRRIVENAPQDVALMAMLWSAHFQDACSAFGMENALMTMLTAPDMFSGVIQRIIDFYLKANAIFYEAAADKLDAVLIGNDLGSQNGLMVSPDLLREFVFPGTKQLIDQAHSHGLKVIHHSCGAIREIIPDLIEMGVDAIHPIQALANGMDAASLKEDFAGKTSFCGGVDTQKLLVDGTPEEVSDKVAELINLFPTGLIISPSHEAVLPDVPPENIEAIFKTIVGNT